jgi:hypothetical protein
LVEEAKLAIEEERIAVKRQKLREREAALNLIKQN